jgi:dipeptidyl aminopeptidase/acylaminoacyl peptidase
MAWYADHDGQVRLAAELKKDRCRLLHRAQRDQPWEAVYEFDIWEEDMFPITFAADNRRIYIAARAGQDTLGLYAFDPVARSLGECLWRNPHHDLTALHFNSGSGDLVGAYYEADRLNTHWFNPKSQSLAARVDQALPGLAKFPVGETEDGSKTVYFAYSDRMPGAYYLFDPAQNRLDHIADAAPWIKPEAMAEMRPVNYSARDGLTIHGYLTLPQGKEQKGLPFIVLPHGGPWARDTWEFDREAQFLANRGYAVLQPNYRSSTGYGLRFITAGYKQYGLKIQDDITDGVQWAIREGIADPKRIAIFGCSFGGYATMVGLTQTPELYRCGINYAGVTDLNRQLRYTTLRSSKRAQPFGRMAIGDYRKEKDLLKEVSPLSHVANIQAPVMLIYGGQDRVVDIEQGRRLEKELKAKKKTYEFVYEPTEGHGFTTPTNVFKLYNRIDAFLRKHMQE